MYLFIVFVCECVCTLGNYWNNYDFFTVSLFRVKGSCDTEDWSNDAEN